MEEWRDIEGYEGLYMVSNMGQIKSLPRNGTKNEERILKPIINERGYCKIHLSKDDVVKTFHIARLVGLAFPEICGEYFDGAEINHLSEDKLDNRAVNLRFVTKLENNRWGTRIKRVSEQNINGKCSKPVICLTKLGEYVCEYPSINEASRITGINSTLIGKCCNKYECKNGFIYKTAGGYKWEYKEKRTA